MEKTPTLVPKEDKEKEKTVNETLKGTLMEKISLLAAELAENVEPFSFSGIEPNSYEKFRQEEEEFPGFSTPIDKILERLNNEGARVILAEDGITPNIRIVPWLSEDLNSDSILLKHVTVAEGMDEKIKELILAAKELAEIVNK